MAKVFSEDHGALIIVCSRNIDRATLAVGKVNGNCNACKLSVN